MRGVRSLTDYERYEMGRLLVWSGAPDVEKIARLNEAWRAALERDGQKARDMVEADANAGDANAQYIMGLVTVTSSGLPQRFTDAEPWLQKAADQNQPMAMEFLADNGLHGRGAHPLDKTVALDLLRRAEQLGYSDAGNELCTAYIEGNGVNADPAEAASHCRRRAELGNGSSPGAELTVMETFKFLLTNWMPRDVIADLIFEHPELVQSLGFPVIRPGLN